MKAIDINRHLNALVPDLDAKTVDRVIYGDHPPATTLLEIKTLVNPDVLIEIEAEAILDE